MNKEVIKSEFARLEARIKELEETLAQSEADNMEDYEDYRNVIRKLVAENLELSVKKKKKKKRNTDPISPPDPLQPGGWP